MREASLSSSESTVNPKIKGRGRPKHDHTAGNQHRLSEAQKRAIVALVATGMTKVQVAQRFKVHPNTVSTLCKPVSQVKDSPLNPDWKGAQLPLAIAAVDRALIDTTDVYKAGAIAVNVLKGHGVYREETQSNVNVWLGIVQSAVPDHLRGEYLDDVIDVHASSTDALPTTTNSGE